MSDDDKLRSDFRKCGNLILALCFLLWLHVIACGVLFALGYWKWVIPVFISTVPWVLVISSMLKVWGDYRNRLNAKRHEKK